ncbi:TPA: fimbrial protein [Salmonella enterica subsp. enterica serovar Java]
MKIQHRCRCPASVMKTVQGWSVIVGLLLMTVVFYASPSRATTTSTVVFKGNITGGTCQVGVVGGNDTVILSSSLSEIQSVKKTGGEIAGASIALKLDVDCSQALPSALHPLSVRVETPALAPGDNTLAYNSASSAVNRGLGVSLKGPDNPAGAGNYYVLGRVGSPAVIKAWPVMALPSAAAGNNIIPLTFHLRRADVTQALTPGSGFDIASLIFSAHIP